VYLGALLRPVDPSGQSTYLPLLTSGAISRPQMCSGSA